MPLQRRLPKRGFTNIFKKVWVEVKLADLEARFDGSEEITPDLLTERGIIRRSTLAKSDGLVILGQGELRKALNIAAHRFTTGAREKIEAAGGKATVIEPKKGPGREPRA
jgi:large subunit ribosomal protein L15